jgi:hypothetical protein
MDPNPNTNNVNAGNVPASSQTGDSKNALSTILSFTQGLIPLLVAIFVLWYFGTTLKRMFGLTNPNITGEIEWGRNTYLFSGLEALAYAAAGFLFGREVNRQRAERAEENATKAQATAQESQAAAAIGMANGQALAAGIRALDDSQAEHPEVGKPTAAATKPVGVPVLRRMADALFP